MRECGDAAPSLVIAPEWQRTHISGEMLGAEVAANLRERFRNGELIFVRAPLTIKDKDNQSYKTSIDLFKKKRGRGKRARRLL